MREATLLRLRRRTAPNARELLRRVATILAVLVAICVGIHSSVAQASTTPLELMVLGAEMLCRDAGEVHLVGLTNDAPALLEVLDSSDTLSDVRFAAPTTRDEGATQDRFEKVDRQFFVKLSYALQR